MEKAIEPMNDTIKQKILDQIELNLEYDCDALQDLISSTMDDDDFNTIKHIIGSIERMRNLQAALLEGKEYCKDTICEVLDHIMEMESLD